MPAKIMRIEDIMQLSNHTPKIPPIIEITNITKSMIVREEVGNTYEAIKLAEEEAGEAKRNNIMMNISLTTKDSI